MLGKGKHLQHSPAQWPERIMRKNSRQDLAYYLNGSIPQNLAVHHRSPPYNVAITRKGTNGFQIKSHHIRDRDR